MIRAAGLESAAWGVLIALVLFAGLSQGGFWGWGLLGLRVLIGVALILWLGSAVMRGFLRWPPLPLTLAALAYLVITAMGAVSSPYPYGSAQALLDTAMFVAAFFLGYVFRPSCRPVLLAGFGLGAGILGVYGLWQALGLGVTRVSGLYLDSNHYSGFLALAVPITLGLALSSRGFGRGLWVGLAVLLFVNLALTFSWGLLAVALALAGWLLAGFERQRGWAGVLRGGLLALSLVGLALLMLVSLSPQLAGNLGQRTAQLLGDWVGVSLESRARIGRGSLELVKTHPWLGVGPGNFVYAWPRYRPPKIETVPEEILHKRINYAHNDYLQVASETGLLGLAAFLGFWILVLRKGPHSPVGTGIKVGLIALLLHGLTDGNLTFIPANAVLTYLFAGLYVGEMNDPD
ncbi:MAG TPA: O-antigen ligase family protein [Meiothermus sp.]|nr:O-antigen ligase family protein [Meiothermus sp.]